MRDGRAVQFADVGLASHPQHQVDLDAEFARSLQLQDEEEYRTSRSRYEAAHGSANSTMSQGELPYQPRVRRSRPSQPQGFSQPEVDNRFAEYESRNDGENPPGMLYMEERLEKLAEGGLWRRWQMTITVWRLTNSFSQPASRPLTLFYLELNKSTQSSKLPRLRDLVHKDMAEVKDKDKSMIIADMVVLLPGVAGAASRAGVRALAVMPDRRYIRYVEQSTNRV